MRDYPDVFSKELSWINPRREVDFHINLIQKATSSSKNPKWFAPIELVELEKQFDELLDKGFIHPGILR